MGRIEWWKKTTQLVASRENRESGILRQVADRFLQADDVQWQTFDRFAQGFGQTLSAQVAQMVQDDAPVTEDMMPEEIHAKYVSKNRGTGLSDADSAETEFV